MSIPDDAAPAAAAIVDAGAGAEDERGGQRSGGVPKPKKQTAAAAARDSLSRPWASLAALVMAVLWTIPTVGLLVTSFRSARDINSSGWWSSFTNPGAYTLTNYQQALAPGRSSLAEYFVNSAVITVPAVLLPMLLASLAAYAFAWMD
ncbi:MAG: sugar ABC transporter permease, partial [Micrococcales bacterium]